MEEYKERFLVEYRELSERIEKLGAILAKHESGTLDFKPTCSIKLLEQQLGAMVDYQAALRARAHFEGLIDEVNAIDAEFVLAEKMSVLTDALVEFAVVLEKKLNKSVSVICKVKDGDVNNVMTATAKPDSIVLPSGAISSGVISFADLSPEIANVLSTMLNENH